MPWFERGDPFQQGGGVGGSFGQEGAEPFVINVALHGRLTFPIGQLQDSDNIVVAVPGGVAILFEDHLRYGDLFDPGLGLTLEGAILFVKPDMRQGGGMHSRSPTFGVYVALQADEFNGDSATDDFGNKIKADDMRIFSALAGIKVAQSLQERAFADVRLGFGVARYEEVDAKFSPFLGPSLEGTLFEETTGYIFELRGHGAWRVGPLAFVGGAGFRIIEQPEGGDDLGIDGISPKTLLTLDFDIGVELGF